MKKQGSFLKSLVAAASLSLLAACPSPKIMRMSAGGTFASELNTCGITVQNDFRRLTAAEYRASVKDLLGVEVTEGNLPPDAISTMNFDNDSSMDHLSDLNADLIYTFADSAAKQANASGKSLLACTSAGTLTIDPVQAPAGVTVTLQETGSSVVTASPDHRLGLNGTKNFKFASGVVGFVTSTVTLNMLGTPTVSDNVYPHFLVSINGKQVFEGNITSTQAKNYTIALPTPVSANSELNLGVTMTNNKWESDTSDRNIDIMAVTLASTAQAAATLSVADCKKQGLRAFLFRAFGVPPSTDTIAAYQAIMDSETDEIVGQTKMETAVIVSPRFLFTMMDFGDNLSGDQKASYMVLQRASLFLWGSRIPSQTALESVEAGTSLTTEDAIRSLAQAMLPDAHSDRLVSNAFDRWLRIDGVNDLHVDTNSFPEATPALLASMKQETEKFVRNNLDSKLKIGDLFESNESFVNKGLADLYGVPSQNISATAFSKVTLPKNERVGLWTQASVLTQGNPGITTSPIKRSVYYLHVFECTNLQTPKDVDVDAIASANPPPANSTVKESLAFHAALGGTCMGCHAIIDPMGIAFEGYSADGAVRTRYPGNNMKVETDEVFNSKKFDGAPDLVTNILRESHKEDACMTRHLLAYALNSTVSPKETCSNAIVSALDPSKATLENLIVSIMNTDAFKALRRE